MSWYKDKGIEGGIAISSRVRLARNIKNMPFPHKMTAEQMNQMLSMCREAYSGSKWLSKEFAWLDLEQIPVLERQKMVEKHLISPRLLDNITGRAVILSTDEKISIMINEEDHIRIQVISAGLELEGLLVLAEKAADELAKCLGYSYSAKLGYLTSCPTNIGTGIRASVMMHLPALTESGHMSQLLAAVSRMGIAVRGLYGEGSEAVGSIYQVSNQVTLGLSEQDIVKRLLGIIQNILEKETELRKRMVTAKGLVFEDRIWRSYGVLKNARILSTSELLELLSDVRLGADTGAIAGIEPPVLNSLIIETSPGHIMTMLSGEADALSRDIKRAELVRENI